jgi:hypothetical protein
VLAEVRPEQTAGEISRLQAEGAGSGWLGNLRLSVSVQRVYADGADQRYPGPCRRGAAEPKGPTDRLDDGAHQCRSGAESPKVTVVEWPGAGRHLRLKPAAGAHGR